MSHDQKLIMSTLFWYVYVFMLTHTLGCVRGLSNEGMPMFRHNEIRGNLYIRFDIDFPGDQFLPEDNLKVSSSVRDTSIHSFISFPSFLSLSLSLSPSPSLPLSPLSLSFSLSLSPSLSLPPSLSLSLSLPSLSSPFSL